MRWVTTLNKLSPQAIQDMLDELAASPASRKRAWENLQEIRWVIKDMTGTGLPLAARKTIDPEGRIVKDGAQSDTGSAARPWPTSFTRSRSTASLRRIRP
jgi:hypothetical protein